MSAPDPSQVSAELAEILDQIDIIRAESEHEADVAALDAQADLCERAHSMLTDALEHLDRV